MEATATSLVYFEKEIVSSGILIKGAPVPWEVLDGNQGVIALDPATQGELIAGLNEMASKQVGGVVKIDAEEYEKKKLESPYTGSDLRPKEMLRVMHSHREAPHPFSRTPAVPVVADTEPERHPATASTQLTAPPQPDSVPGPKPESETSVTAAPATAQELKLNVGRASEKLRLSKEPKAA